MVNLDAALCARRLEAHTLALQVDTANEMCEQHTARGNPVCHCSAAAAADEDAKVLLRTTATVSFPFARVRVHSSWWLCPLLDKVRSVMTAQQV